MAIFFTLEAIELKVKKQEAVAFEPFEIVVEAQGREVEFDRVERIGGYEVAQSNYVKNTLIINNQISYESRLVLSIYPEDDFVIEPIGAVVDGKRVYTKEMEIKVRKPQSNAQREYFMQLSSDKESVYEKEPILVTVKLFESKERKLLDISYSPPSKKGFFVKQLGNEKKYEEDGYIVYEISYLYYPQKSGTLEIDAATARIGVPVRVRDFFGETVVAKHQKISSNALKIDVKPLPQSVDLVGEADLKVEISNTKVDANEPIFLDIEIKGRANFDDFKGFAIDIDGVTVFEGAKEIEFDHFKQSFSLVAQESFEIPSFEVVLFDTNDETVKVIASEAIAIEVEAKNIRETTKETIIITKEVTALWKIVLGFVLGGFTGVIATIFLMKKRTKRGKKGIEVIAATTLL